jgi:hypothetical protein
LGRAAEGIVKGDRHPGQTLKVRRIHRLHAVGADVLAGVVGDENEDVGFRHSKSFSIRANIQHGTDR